MTQKEIAKQLRNMSKRIDELTQDSLTDLADQLDPPRAAAGTLVWWRHKSMDLNEDKWEIGEASYEGVWSMGSYMMTEWEAVEYKPARILAPDEVAIKREEAERMQRDD